MKELDIRYIKLCFTLQFPEDCELPVNKTSALRGGMGEMLLRADCIRDRECEKCDFSEECIVQRTMYSKLAIEPSFMTSGDSVGYVIECENYETQFSAGDTLDFYLILFGKTIVYFNQYLTALYALGQQGIGRTNAVFQILQVRNTHGENILQGNNAYMKHYQPELVSDYVAWRLRKLQETEINGIRFKTPTTIKYGGEFLREFDMNAIIKSIQRRIYILDCFEGIDGEELYRRELQIPNLIHQTVEPIQVKRYSNRKEETMYLKGIKGSVELEGISEELLPLMLAGELLHIGKNTSFGFGRYVLK